MTSNVHRRINPRTGRAELAVPVGTAMVSDYCGNLIAQCEQRQLSVARRIAPRLARLRSRINRIDHWMARDARQLARESALAEAEGANPFVPPFPPLIFWLVAAAISALEVFVNKYGLDGLRMAESASWGMALMAALSLFLLSKATARLLRQRAWRHGAWGEVAICAIGNAVLLLAAWHIADARAFVAAAEAASRGQSVMEGIGQGFVAFVLLGYAAMLFMACQNTPPDMAEEQRMARIAALRRSLNLLWLRRIVPATVHNFLLAVGEFVIAWFASDLAERSFQFRAGVKRGGLCPAYFREALPIAALRPIHLGNPVDPSPMIITAVLDCGDDAEAAEDGGNGPASDSEGEQ